MEKELGSLLRGLKPLRLFARANPWATAAACLGRRSAARRLAEQREEGKIWDGPKYFGFMTRCSVSFSALFPRCRCLASFPVARSCPSVFKGGRRTAAPDSFGTWPHIRSKSRHPLSCAKPAAPTAASGSFCTLRMTQHCLAHRPQI